jgi:hypothetical protein
MRQVFDIETGFDSTLLNLNPDGWVEGVTTEKSWRMLYGMDVGVERQLIIAGAPLQTLPALDSSKGTELLFLVGALRSGSCMHVIYLCRRHRRRAWAGQR